MSAQDRPRRLVLHLTDEEWAAVERAADREGFDEIEVPIFVREALLELLRSRGELPSPREKPLTPEPPPTAPGGESRIRPKCGCGMSRNADGACDLSCILRL